MGCGRCMHGADPLVWSDEVASFARVSESGVPDLCRFRSREHFSASVVAASFVLITVWISKARVAIFQ